MLRVEVSEAGQEALPAIDVDDAIVVIGSATNARIRLPGGAAEREHVRVEGNRWRALAPVRVDGIARDSGEIGDGITLELAGYRLRLAPAPAGTAASPAQRTESLARELIRGLLGNGAQPTLEIERGPAVGAKRALAPPDSTLVIGRGDEAQWIIADKDLSRTHAEVRRGWDGTRIVDLDSKNGTKVDGTPVTREGMPLRDGCLVELGPIVMRFRDPAEKHLLGDAPAFRALGVAEAKRAAELKPQPSPRRTAGLTPSASSEREPPRGSPLVFYAALATMLLALAGLVWVLTS